MRRELVLICLVAIPLALSAQNASPAPQQAAPEVHNKNANATKQVKGPSGDFVIWYDPTKWRIKEANPTGYVLEFETTNGEGHATISSEKGRIPNLMAAEAVVHARIADPSAKITAREERIVNGREVLMQQIECTFASLPLHFYTYYYAGTFGTVEANTYTTQASFAKNVSDLTNFLDGLMITDQPLPQRAAPKVHNKNANATKQVKGPSGDFVIWYDPAKWRTKITHTTGNVLEFETTNGKGHATISSNKGRIRTDVMADTALVGARIADPGAKITAREERIVNGREVLMQQIECTFARLPLHFYTYYYAGTSGTVEISTYTTQASFAKNVSDLTNFLDGLVITDQAASNAEVGGSTVVLLNDGKASLEYDNKKWRQRATTEDGHLGFALRRGDGFAVVEVNRIEVPFDALPNVVLNLAQRGDPNARITFKEKRTVNRVEVWFVKLDATTSGVPLTFYEYLYSSKAGTIQLITATGQNLIGDYEADFLEFLKISACASCSKPQYLVTQAKVDMG